MGCFFIGRKELQWQQTQEDYPAHKVAEVLMSTQSHARVVGLDMVEAEVGVEARIDKF